MYFNHIKCNRGVHIEIYHGLAGNRARECPRSNTQNMVSWTMELLGTPRVSYTCFQATDHTGFASWIYWYAAMWLPTSANQFITYTIIYKQSQHHSMIFRYSWHTFYTLVTGPLVDIWQMVWYQSTKDLSDDTEELQFSAAAASLNSVPISCDNAASNEGAKEQSVLFKRTAFCHCPTRHSSFFTHSQWHLFTILPFLITEKKNPLQWKLYLHSCESYMTHPHTYTIYKITNS